MGTKAKFKVSGLEFESEASNTINNLAIFADIADNIIKQKTSGGATDSIGAGGGGGIDRFLKQMTAGEAIAAGRPFSIRSDGKVLDAGSDKVDGQQVIGITSTVATADGDLINVILVGPNLAGVLTGLGFQSGEEIFLNEGGGYTNDTTGFTGNNDSIIKLGVATGPAGAPEAIATDLVAFPEIILRP